MDTIYDLSGILRTWLLTQSDVTALVEERIFQPLFFDKDGSHAREGEDNPKIMFRHDGGAPDYRYLFVVEADAHEDAREVATLLQNKLIKGALDLQAGTPLRTVITTAIPVGGLNDSRNEVMKYAQVWFSVTFVAA